MNSNFPAEMSADDFPHTQGGNFEFTLFSLLTTLIYTKSISVLLPPLYLKIKSIYIISPIHCAKETWHVREFLKSALLTPDTRRVLGSSHTGSKEWPKCSIFAFDVFNFFLSHFCFLIRLFYFTSGSENSSESRAKKKRSVEGGKKRWRGWHPVSNTHSGAPSRTQST